MKLQSTLLARRWFPALLTCAALSCLPLLDARTFTSADGTKTVEAELIDYRPANGTVIIQYQGQNTRRTVNASAFSEADNEYFKEFLKEKIMRDSLRIQSSPIEERSQDGGDLYTYTRLNSQYRVSVRNAGKLTVDGLTAKYDIYVQRYDQDGGRKVEVESGVEMLDAIPVNLDAIFETKTVKVTLGCKTSSSCPTCVDQAESVERERILGLRVRLYNDKDELMSEYHSSTSLRSVASAHDDESQG